MDIQSKHEQIETPVVPRVDLDDELRELADLAGLGDDWDSFGSKAISAAAIHDARTLVTRAALHNGVRPYAIAPLSGSGVQLEWRGHDNRLEVEVYGQERFHFLLIEGRGASRQSTEKRNASLNDILDALSVVAAH